MTEQPTKPIAKNAPEHSHLPNEFSFSHKGIEIIGINFLEEKGILTRKDVTELIDGLPTGYFSEIPLGTINFLPYRLFSVERDGKILYIKDDELLTTDKIIARKRGNNRWNQKMVKNIAVPTDGKMTINIFSPENWDDKQDKQIDKNTALYALAHELGHTIWGTIIYGPGIFDNLKKMKVPIPCSTNAINYLPFIERWKNLQESTIKAYLDYKAIVAKEDKSDSTGYVERSLEVLFKEEDFAISYGHFLFWKNLANLDQQRFKINDELFNEMNKQVLTD